MHLILNVFKRFVRLVRFCSNYLKLHVKQESRDLKTYLSTICNSESCSNLQGFIPGFDQIGMRCAPQWTVFPCLLRSAGITYV